MPTNIQKAILLASSAVGLVTAAAPAIAQDSPADIIVTARRVEERLQDVPISITVFNQAALTARNVFNAGDLATYTPSLAANGRFGSENTSFAIRGFVQDPSTPPSVAVYFADVAALRAAGGTTLGNGAGPGAFFDLANVQVLKGAQGTLFGRNTTGGAVLLVPQKPTGKFEGYIEGSYGNYDMKRIQAVLNVPIMDSLRIRLGVDHQDRTGYLHNYSGIGPRDFADVNYTAGRFSATAELTPNLENYFVGTYSDSDTHGFLPKVFTCAPGIYPGTAATNSQVFQAQLGCNQIARENAFGDKYGVDNETYSPRQHITQWQLIDTLTYKPSDTLTIKSIASYGEFREYFRGSPYGEYLTLPNGPNAGRLLTKVQTSPLPGGNSAGESTFTEELQFQGRSTDDRLNWQGGLYTELSEPINVTGSVTPSSAVCTTDLNTQCLNPGTTPNITGLIIGRLNKQYFHDYAVYAQGTYKLTDKFSVTAGARYTWDKTGATTQQYRFFLPTVPGGAPLAPGITCIVGTPVAPATTATLGNNCTQSFLNTSHRPTWIADVDYKPTEDILAYAKYTRGYRAAGIKTDGGAAYSTFAAEKVDTYEGGIKTSFRGMLSGTLNVSAFYSKFLSAQLAASLNPNPAGALANTTANSVVVGGARSRIYGVEVESSLNLFKGFRADLSYAYLNTKLLSVATPPNTSSSTVPDYLPPVPSSTAVGYPLAFAPHNKFSLTGSYTLPLEPSFGKVTVSGTFTHTDHQYVAASYHIPVSTTNATIPANVIGTDYGVLPSTNLVNASVTWTSVMGSKFDLSAFATNLTNHYYAAAVFGGIAAFGFDSEALAEPRMYGLRVKYRFGGR